MKISEARSYQLYCYLNEYISATDGPIFTDDQKRIVSLVGDLNVEDETYVTELRDMALTLDDEANLNDPDNVLESMVEYGWKWEYSTWSKM